MSAPRDPPGEAPPFRDGEIIAGKYEVDRVLGQGGMGVVVAAHHIALQQKVAIKLMLPAAMAIPGAAQRFLREARSAVAIQSEHVARVLDVGTLDSGPPFMVMEYLTGSDLGEVLRRSGKLPVGVAIDYVLQACEAIAEAHSLGIVHRDLKPDNVFLTKRADGSALVKVLDFGLSKPTKDDGLGGATPSLTATNLVAGSPQYMSPEQVRGLKNADHRTDVWALGVILFELITGQRPFEADSVAGIFAKIAADAPTRPRVLRPDMPPPLEGLILRCLEKDVTRRVQDVAELAQGLSPFGPPEARTSVERVVRLVGNRAAASLGAAGSPAAPPSRDVGQARPREDALEADIPTMAAPGPAVMVAAPRSAPIVTGPRSAPTAVPTRVPFVPTAEMELDVVRPASPVDRGRVSSRAALDEPRTQVGDLQLGAPLRVLGVAILIADADMVLVRVMGQTLTVGPVRPLWVAGPLAILGAAWIVARLVRR